jgi:hypothetical protein
MMFPSSWNPVVAGFSEACFGAQGGRFGAGLDHFKLPELVKKLFEGGSSD